MRKGVYYSKRAFRVHAEDLPHFTVRVEISRKALPKAG